MANTLDLLSRALAGAPSAAALARELHIDNSTITQARKRGRLSPTLAGQLAQRLGENPAEWIALAALEAEPPTSARSRLMRVIEHGRNSYFALMGALRWLYRNRQHDRSASALASTRPAASVAPAQGWHAV